VIAYVDTSALVKLVVPEQGSELAERIWRDAEPYASLLGYVELRAAVAAGARRLALDPRTASAVELVAHAVWARIAPVRMSDRLVRAAGDIAVRHGLRAADAIHLASAIEVAGGLAASSVFLTFDQRLAEAARAEGFRVLPETA
jgi:predicted nucleic acid-binding protein